MGKQLELQGIVQPIEHRLRSKLKTQEQANAQMAQAAGDLLKKMELLVGTSQKVNDNGIQVTIVVPKGLWTSLERIVKPDEGDSQPPPAQTAMFG